MDDFQVMYVQFQSYLSQILGQYICSVINICFFFSSRRRHTRSLCDWSSDVCSSDLEIVVAGDFLELVGRLADGILRIAPVNEGAFGRWRAFPGGERGARNHGKRAGQQRAPVEEIGRASCRERVEKTDGEE